MTSIIVALPTTDTDTVLDRAADYLTRYGWIPTGLYNPHDGCVDKQPCTVTGDPKCWPRLTGRYPASILGAIRFGVFGAPRWFLDTAAPADLHTYTAAVEWFNTYLIAIGHAGQHGPVFDWQTTPGRTPAEVRDALRAAASAYRRHERRAVA